MSYATYPNTLHSYPMQTPYGMPLSAMPMMGIGMGSGGMFNHVFMYNGNAIGLQTRLEGLEGDTELQGVREATINCTGNQISQLNICCLMCTVIWGGILIFPLCFMCCNWWKKKVYPAFQVPQQTYRSLRSLLSSPSMQVLTLLVIDNKLNAEKCNILYEQLSKSKSLRGFTLVNNASTCDYDEQQYSRFEENMRQVKGLTNVVTEIKWGAKLVR